MLIKGPVKFEDIPTFLTTRINIDIKFNKNLQFGGRLTVALKPYGVQLGQMKSLFLLLQAFQVTLAR